MKLFWIRVHMIRLDNVSKQNGHQIVFIEASTTRRLPAHLSAGRSWPASEAPDRRHVQHAPPSTCSRQSKVSI
jgi:hypothetical protein